MNVQDALARIHAPKGMTSIIGGLLSGDTASIQRQDATGIALEAARTKLAEVRAAQENCGSDWAYWGYEGDKAYWRAAVNILEAAELCGPDNLPDVPAPDTDGLVVMDACSKVEKYGADVLRLARETPRVGRGKKR